MKTATLGEVAEIVSGGTPRTGVAEYWGGDVPWATPADLSGLDGAYISDTPRLLTKAGVQSCATKVLPAGSVLLSSRAPIGHVAINTVPMATNQGFKSVVPGPELDAKYLYHWLKSKTAYLQSLGNGATFMELSKKTTEGIAIPLPPVVEQQRIAAILDKTNAVRANRQQVLSQLGSLTQSLFHAMFSAGEHEVVRLKDIIKWGSGKFLPGRMQRAGTYPVYGGNGVSGRHDEYMFEEPRLVVGRVGAYCGAVHLTQPRAWVTDNALIATILRDELTLDYLAMALTLQNLNQYASVSGQPSISGTRIGEAQLAAPPISLQRLFSERVVEIQRQIESANRALDATDELIASLRARAFRGYL